MNELDKKITVIRTDSQFESEEANEIAVPDYDDLPYGDDNVLVRASKRKAFIQRDYF